MITIKDEPIEVITIKDEPEDAPAGFFSSVAPHYHQHAPTNLDYRTFEPFEDPEPYQPGPSSQPHPSYQAYPSNQPDHSIQTVDQRSSRATYSLVNQSGQQESTPPDTQVTRSINSQTDKRTDTPTDWGTDSQTETDYSSNTAATIPRYTAGGKLLTLGQRLALISATQDTSKHDPTITHPPLSPSNSKRRKMEEDDNYSHRVRLKVLVPERVLHTLYRQHSLYQQGSLRIQMSLSEYPEQEECQIFMEGTPKKVLSALTSIGTELRSTPHSYSRQNNRSETMLLVADGRVAGWELLKSEKTGGRRLHNIEQRCCVWIRIREPVQEECVIAVTGHSQQMHHALSEVLELLVFSPFTDALSPTFHYERFDIPQSSHGDGNNGDGFHSDGKYGDSYHSKSHHSGTLSNDGGDRYGYFILAPCDRDSCSCTDIRLHYTGNYFRP